MFKKEKMTNITCALCGLTLRKDKALLDAKWEEFQDKYICRECAKEVAQMVIDEY